MDKNIDVFAKIPQPKTEQDHNSIQESLVQMEANDHQMIEIEKGIEVMDAHKNDNEFVLSALQERCQDYTQSIDKLKQNINALSKLITDKTKQSELNTYIETIQNTEKAYDDFNALCESIEIQKHRINSIGNGEDLITSKLKEVDVIGSTIYNLELNTDEALSHVMNFIQDIQTLQQSDSANNPLNSDDDEAEKPAKKQTKKKGPSKKKQPKNIKIDHVTYKQKKFEIKGILSKYFEEKLIDTSSESSHSDVEIPKQEEKPKSAKSSSSRKKSEHSERKSKSGDEDDDDDEKSKSGSGRSSRKSSRSSSQKSSRKSSGSSNKSSNRSSRSSKKSSPRSSKNSSPRSSKNRSESEEKQSNNSENHEDEQPQLSVEDLQIQIQSKDEEIDKVRGEIDRIKEYKLSNMTEEQMLQEKANQFEKTLNELVDKNLIGSSKIETLFGKVRRSREKIDQVLNDLFTYQKEFETIQINKKSKQPKLKTTKKIMETRLEVFKNYLLHLQSVIDGLEKQIRDYRKREKEEKKQAQIAGVGVTQKHNTYADQLKAKILTLEGLIEKNSKPESKPK